MLYPDAHIELNFTTPLELSVATILSAQCTDKRVNEVTPTVFRRYPDAAAYAGADRAELEELIRTTGFFRNKTTSLIKLGQALVERFDGEVPNRMADLVSLPGFGRKTANVVLGNAFGIPGITVDTHFGRLSRRWQWTRETDPVKVEAAVGLLIPREGVDDSVPSGHLARPPRLPCPQTRMRRVFARPVVPSYGEGPDRSDDRRGTGEDARAGCRDPVMPGRSDESWPEWLGPLYAPLERSTDGTSRPVPVLSRGDPGIGGAHGDVRYRGRSRPAAHRAGAELAHACWPGGVSGRCGRSGDVDPAATALREAHEEVGLDPATVVVAATLPSLYLPPSGYIVHPVLAWWARPHPVRVVDAAEVAGVAIVPVAELRRTGESLPGDAPVRFVGPAFAAGGLFVWGFTAALIDGLLRLGGWARDWDRGALRPIPMPSETLGTFET